MDDAETSRVFATTTETSASYRRVRTIASGGMGEVELAMRREGTFLRLYAIKRLHAHLREDAEVRAMFVDEARIAGLLRHPNVVSVVDVGQDARGPLLVMEYVEGVSLSALIQHAASAGEPVPLEVAVRIVQQAACGLAAAHELTSPSGEPLQLVHRDVSPANILVGVDGVARVTDFGIARALGRQSKTSTGILKGKLGYMAPEQLRFRAPDQRSDLFALGVVLCELVAARRLYSGEPEETARRILEEPPPDLTDVREDVPPELVDLVFRLLAKDPAHRPADARAVVRALDVVLAELSASGAHAEVGEHVARISGPQREAERAELARAIADAERDDETAMARASARHSLPPRSRRFAVVAGGMTLTLIAGLAAWAALGPSADETASAADRELAPSAAPPSDVATPALAAPAGDPVTDESTAMPEGADGPDDGRARADSPARTRGAPRPRARTRSRARRSGSDADGPRLWGWQ